MASHILKITFEHIRITLTQLKRFNSTNTQYLSIILMVELNFIKNNFEKKKNVCWDKIREKLKLKLDLGDVCLHI